MTTNNQCNHAEAIAREMHMYYAAQAHNESNTPIPHWPDLTENEQTGKLLQAQMDAEDFAQAAQTVHKVKSSSSSIGAKQLAQCAEKLQKALQTILLRIFSDFLIYGRK